MTGSDPADGVVSEGSRVRRVVAPLSLIPLGLGVHVVLPFLLSLIAPRYGWDGGPGAWNLVGLIPVALGLGMIVWALSLHFVGGTGVVNWEGTPRGLLLNGPYGFSRNPMYVLELAMWLGWTIFYGSFAVLSAFVLWWLFFALVQVPAEERQLEARFGESYLQYRRTVPRWFGRRRG